MYFYIGERSEIKGKGPGPVKSSVKSSVNTRSKSNPGTSNVDEDDLDESSEDTLSTLTPELSSILKVITITITLYITMNYLYFFIF